VIELDWWIDKGHAGRLYDKRGGLLQGHSGVGGSQTNEELVVELGSVGLSLGEHSRCTNPADARQQRHGTQDHDHEAEANHERHSVVVEELLDGVFFRR